MLKLTGYTYELRKTIKKYGGSWSKEKKYWEISELNWESFKNEEGMQRIHSDWIEMYGIKEEIITD